MLWNLLLLIAVVFIVYALWKFYAKTPYEYGWAKRVWTALGLAVAAIASWLAVFFNQGGVPS